MRITIAFVVALLIAATNALPFSKNSGVRELNGQKELTEALKTHKPVMLLLYAPWCGHCKAIHPEYEKLGKMTEGVVEVLAVDADKHREVGGPYNLKGFPTVVYYGMDKKKGWKPYQQERQAGAMNSFAMSLVDNAAGMIKDEAQFKKFLDSNTHVVALFTEKAKVPPLMHVLAADPGFKGTVPFIVVQKKLSAIVDKFEIAKYPSIALLGKEEGEVKAKAWFDGKIAYAAIRAFARKELGLPEDAKGSSGSTPPPTPKKPTVAKPAVPLSPIEFNEGQMKLFCNAESAPSIHEQQPFCVVFFVGADDVEGVKGVHAKFSNEPFIVMYSTDAALAGKLNMIESPKVPAFAVFKAGKKGVKYYGESFEATEQLFEKASKVLENISGGEQKLKKMDALPKL